MYDIILLYKTVKTNTYYNVLPLLIGLLGSHFDPFFAFKGVSPPLDSLLPLRAAVWQWVAIQYLSAPPPCEMRLYSLCLHQLQGDRQGVGPGILHLSVMQGNGAKDP